MRPIAIPKSICNAAEPWTDRDIRQLRDLAARNTPTSVISLKLGRPKDAVQAKAAELSIRLEPANRPPYGVTS